MKTIALLMISDAVIDSPFADVCKASVQAAVDLIAPDTIVHDGSRKARGWIEDALSNDGSRALRAYLLNGIVVDGAGQQVREWCDPRSVPDAKRSADQERRLYQAMVSDCYRRMLSSELGVISAAIDARGSHYGPQSQAELKVRSLGIALVPIHFVPQSDALTRALLARRAPSR